MSDDHTPYITTYRSMNGWKAIHVWWNPEMGGFWEPYDTGIGYYATEAEAALEAKEWSIDSRIRYVENTNTNPNGA